MNGFLRYIQQRDHGQSEEDTRRGGVDGFLRYAAFRDRTTARARLFVSDRDATQRDRRRLADYVRRSTVGLEATGGRRRRAVYRMVLSPEDARGLDLRQLTRAVMTQLERDAGGELGPWIAAEHRNTAHPHVHIVLAARRPAGPGRYSELLITRPRLERMKHSLAREMSRQREHLRVRDHLERVPMEQLVGSRTQPDRRRWPPLTVLARTMRRASAHYRHELERELEQQRARDLQLGWER